VPSNTPNLFPGVRVGDFIVRDLTGVDDGVETWVAEVPGTGTPDVLVLAAQSISGAERIAKEAAGRGRKRLLKHDPDALPAYAAFRKGGGPEAPPAVPVAEFRAVQEEIEVQPRRAEPRDERPQPETRPHTEPPKARPRPSAVPHIGPPEARAHAAAAPLHRSPPPEKAPEGGQAVVGAMIACGIVAIFLRSWFEDTGIHASLALALAGTALAAFAPYAMFVKKRAEAAGGDNRNEGWGCLAVGVIAAAVYGLVLGFVSFLAPWFAAGGSGALIGLLGAAAWAGAQEKPKP